MDKTPFNLIGSLGMALGAQKLSMLKLVHHLDVPVNKNKEQTPIL